MINSSLSMAVTSVTKSLVIATGRVLYTDCEARASEHCTVAI